MNATGHANHNKKEPHGLRVVAEAKPVSASSSSRRYPWECSHTETRTRTVHTTDSNGHRHSHQETYTVTITSFSHSYGFTQACKTLDHTPFNGLDVSTVVDIARDSSQLYVEFDSKQTLSQSPTAAAYLNEWKDKLYNANKHRDSRCNAWVHLTTPSVNVVKEQMVRSWKL